MTKRASIYCRISDDKMEDQAGVDRQEADCRKICERRGWGIVSVHVDNSKSAWKRGTFRPGWENLMAEVRADEIDAIVVYHPDRLMRRPRDLEDLLDAGEQGVSLYGTVGEYDLDNSDHRFILRIIVAAACKASDDASRRQKRKQQELAEAGGWKGGSRPFGFEPDGIQHRPAEVDVIRELVSRFLAGETLRSLTRWLNDTGVQRVTRKGKWLEINVRQILDSPRMAGLRRYHGQCDLPKGQAVCPRSCQGKLFPAQWEPIVSETDWRECVEILRGNHGRWLNLKAGQRIYEAVGVVRCSLCAHKMYSTGGSKMGYACLSIHGGCGKMHIGKNKLEPLMHAAVSARLVRGDLGGRQRITVELDPAAQEALRADQDQLIELSTAYGQKAITMAEWVAAKKPIAARINAAQAKTVERRTTVKLPVDMNTADKWNAAPPERRRILYDLVFESVTIKPGMKGRFDPARVELAWAF